MLVTVAGATLWRHRLRRRLSTAAVFRWLVSAANKTFKDSYRGDGDAVTLCDLVGRARAERSDAVSEMKSFERSKSSKCSAERWSHL